MTRKLLYILPTFFLRNFIPFVLGLLLSALCAQQQKILVIVTDTWPPDINGVALQVSECSSISTKEITVRVIHPLLFTKRIKVPKYPDLSFVTPSHYNYKYFKEIIKKINPDWIHLATEGPLGYFGKRFAKNHSINFSASHYTNMDDYLWLNFYIPKKITQYFYRKFYKGSHFIAVNTKSQAFKITQIYGEKPEVIRNIVNIKESKDQNIFLNLKRPVFLYVGRVTKEKNLEDFLTVSIPGTKVVIGDGHDLQRLMKSYPNVVFLGSKPHHELGAYYAAADVSVFPSKTDTYGRTIVESLLCGTPVAAFPTQGPQDIDPKALVVKQNENLTFAMQQALTVDRNSCKIFAKSLENKNNLINVVLKRLNQ